VTLDEAIADGGPPHVDLLALDAALTKLAEQDQRKSRIVELRYFGGLSETDIAHAVGISVATVRRDWTAARAWLYRQVRLGQSRPDHPESQ
jgi:RNA polymerase sigma factor (sigma-70 family)